MPTDTMRRQGSLPTTRPGTHASSVMESLASDRRTLFSALLPVFYQVSGLIGFQRDFRCFSRGSPTVFEAGGIAAIPSLCFTSWVAWSVFRGLFGVFCDR